MSELLAIKLGDCLYFCTMCILIQLGLDCGQNSNKCNISRYVIY